MGQRVLRAALSEQRRVVGTGYTLKREDSRTLVLVDDVGCISLTCNDALGTSTGGDTRRNLLRTRCGLEPPSNSSSIGTSASAASAVNREPASPEERFSRAGTCGGPRARR